MTLNRWTPRMGRLGPAAEGERHIRAGLADLRRTDDRELIVTPIRDTPWNASCEDVVVEWAATVGYTRAWLPSRVVALDAVPAPSDVARVRCPTCGARWSDHGLEFWEMVRRDGWFPASCLACGGSLPEWTVGPARRTDADGRPGRVRTPAPRTTRRS